MPKVHFCAHPRESREDIYEEAGLVPASTFQLRHRGSDLCLTFGGPPGTHPQGGDPAKTTCMCASPTQKGKVKRGMGYWPPIDDSPFGKVLPNGRRSVTKSSLVMLIRL